MPTQDDWFLGEHHIEAEVDYLPEEVPEIWRRRADFGRAKGMPELSPEEEIIEMDKQIESSQGFDIDFRKFACLFNYRPVDLSQIDYNEKPPTSIRNVLKKLSKKRLRDYNKEMGTSFKFAKIVKSNFFWCVGKMYFITFEVVDPFDNQRKLFQVKVNYFYFFATDYYLCRPKPGKKLPCVGTLRPQHTSQAEYRIEEDEDVIVNSLTHSTKVVSPVEASKPTRKARGQAQRNPVTAAGLRANRFQVLADNDINH